MREKRKLRRIIKEEVKKLLKEEKSRLKQISYNLAEEMGLRSAYHGAVKTFDGNWNGVEVSIEYHGSGNDLTVFGSPKGQLPSSTNTVQFLFESSDKYGAVLKDGTKLGEFSYTSASSLAERLKKLVEENSED